MGQRPTHENFNYKTFNRNVEEKFYNIDLATIPWIWHQAKNKQRTGFHESQTFCASKDTINRVERKITEWEKIFVNHIFYTVYNPQYTKNCYNSTTIKTDNNKCQ